MSEHDLSVFSASAVYALHSGSFRFFPLHAFSFCLFTRFLAILRFYFLMISGLHSDGVLLLFFFCGFLSFLVVGVVLSGRFISRLGLSFAFLSGVSCLLFPGCRIESEDGGGDRKGGVLVGIESRWNKNEGAKRSWSKELASSYALTTFVFSPVCNRVIDGIGEIEN